MKITKRQLRQIIKEEKTKLLREALDDPGPIEGAAASASSIAMGLREGLLTPENAADRIEKEVKKVLYDYLRRTKGR